MRIICPKCGTEYFLESDQLDPEGTPVQCSACEHTFTVYGTPADSPATADPASKPPATADRSLDGSAPLNPDGAAPLAPEGSAPLAPDGAAPLTPDGSAPRAPRPDVLPPPPPLPRGKKGHSGLFLAQGDRIYKVKDNATLQRWIVEKRVLPGDRISSDGKSWEVVSSRSDLRPFFNVIEQLKAARRALKAKPTDLEDSTSGSIAPPARPAALAIAMAGDPDAEGGDEEATEHRRATEEPATAPGAAAGKAEAEESVRATRETVRATGDTVVARASKRGMQAIVADAQSLVDGRNRAAGTSGPDEAGAAGKAGGQGSEGAARQEAEAAQARDAEAAQARDVKARALEAAQAREQAVRAEREADDRARSEAQAQARIDEDARALAAADREAQEARAAEQADDGKVDRSTGSEWEVDSGSVGASAQPGAASDKRRGEGPLATGDEASAVEEGGAFDASADSFFGLAPGERLEVAPETIGRIPGVPAPSTRSMPVPTPTNPPAEIVGGGPSSFARGRAAGSPKAAGADETLSRPDHAAAHEEAFYAAGDAVSASTDSISPLNDFNPDQTFEGDAVRKSSGAGLGFWVALLLVGASAIGVAWYQFVGPGSSGIYATADPTPPGSQPRPTFGAPPSEAPARAAAPTPTPHPAARVGGGSRDRTAAATPSAPTPRATTRPTPTPPAASSSPTPRPEATPRPTPRPEATPRPTPRPEATPRPTPRTEVAASTPPPAPAEGADSIVKRADAARARGNYRAAADGYEAALQSNPNDFHSALQLGWMRIELSDNSKAISAFTSALALRSSSAEAHYGLGLAYQSRGQADRAITHYERSLELDPSSRDAREVKALLRGLKR